MAYRLLSPLTATMYLTDPTARAAHIQPFRYVLKRWFDMLLQFKNNLTLVYVTYQIVVTLASVHQFKGGSGYPNPLQFVVKVLELITVSGW